MGSRGDPLRALSSCRRKHLRALGGLAQRACCGVRRCVLDRPGRGPETARSVDPPDPPDRRRAPPMKPGSMRFPPARHRPLHAPVAALLLVLFAAVSSPRPASALEECRLMRMPDIQGDRIVFVY